MRTPAGSEAGERDGEDERGDPVAKQVHDQVLSPAWGWIVNGETPGE